MALSRKHFIELAKIVSNIEDCETRQKVGKEVADFCLTENPFFNKELFYEAAGVSRSGDSCVTPKPVG